MPYERHYYVLCDDNCKFESMTKEQIISAIAEATGHTVTDIDEAFITKLKETNRGNAVKIWVGTQAEYNALVSSFNIEEDTIYLTNDGDDISGLIEDVERLKPDVESLKEEALKKGAVLFSGYLPYSQKQYADSDAVYLENKDILKYKLVTVKDHSGNEIVCTVTVDDIADTAAWFRITGAGHECVNFGEGTSEIVTLKRSHIQIDIEGLAFYEDARAFINMNRSFKSDTVFMDDEVTEKQFNGYGVNFIKGLM